MQMAEYAPVDSQTRGRHKGLHPSRRPITGPTLRICHATVPPGGPTYVDTSMTNKMLMYPRRGERGGPADLIVLTYIYSIVPRRGE